MAIEQEIAKLNDALRAKIPLAQFWASEDNQEFYTLELNKNERISITDGIKQLNNWMKIAVFVKTFQNFDKENDPYNEHDFGSIVVDNVKIYFKVDLYEDNWSYGWDREEKPIEDCQRLLTIFLASEY